MESNKLSATQVTKLLFESIVRFFRLPKKFVHDCHPMFTAYLWCELWHILGTKNSTFTIFYPQSDGQNKCLIACSNKSYMCTFIIKIRQHG